MSAETPQREAEINPGDDATLLGYRPATWHEEKPCWLDENGRILCYMDGGGWSERDGDIAPAWRLPSRFNSDLRYLSESAALTAAIDATPNARRLLEALGDAARWRSLLPAIEAAKEARANARIARDLLDETVSTARESSRSPASLQRDIDIAAQRRTKAAEVAGEEDSMLATAAINQMPPKETP